MRHTVRRLAALTLAAAILLPTSALASDDAPAQALGLSSAPQGPWTANLTDPLFSPAARWVPGDAETAGFWARNQSADDTELRVQLTPQVDDPATYDHLDLRVRADGGAWEPFDTAWSTPHALAPGERTHVEIRARMPRSSANSSQGLRFSFAVRALLSATNAGAETPAPPSPAPTGTPGGGEIRATGTAASPDRPDREDDVIPAPFPAPGDTPRATAPLEDGIDQAFWIPALFVASAATLWLAMLVRRRDHGDSEGRESS